MTEERIENLLFMHSHPDITISHAEVIDIFAFSSAIDGPWGSLGARAPPILAAVLRGVTCPTHNFYRIYHCLKSLFTKNKQIEKFQKISYNLFKIFSKF